LRSYKFFLTRRITINNKTTHMALSPVLVGVLFALLGNTLMGISFVVKRVLSKKHDAHEEEELSHSARRCSWIPHQLFRWQWWLATVILFTGEGLNFVGYVKAPASLIVLIGSVNVLVSYALSSLFLKEFFSSLRLAGSMFICAGVSVLVMGSPSNEEGAINTFPEAVLRLFEEIPIVMTGIASVVLVLLLAVSYGNKKNRTEQSYVIPLCMYSCTACLMVITTKVIAIMLGEAANGKMHFNNAAAYLIWPWWFSMVALQLFILNWLLSLKDAGSIVPLMYVCYASTGMLTSGIYFEEFGSRELYQMFLMALAVLLIFSGVYMVTRDISRARGFWFCCPKYPFIPTRKYIDLGIPPLNPYMPSGSTESLASNAFERSEGEQQQQESDDPEDPLIVQELEE
jgi:drug/metabolite transporter (DMT)-like permease